MGQIIFISTLPYMTKLIMQIFRLNETFRMIIMIGHSMLSNNANFVEIGF